MNAWYQELTAPPLTPPDAIFSPVWTVLYIMIAAGIYFWSKSPDRFLARGSWELITLHLLCNAAWTPFFFILQAPGLALADIVLMWLTLMALLVKFWKESRRAYWLWLPYFFWVSFAMYLNAGFWWLNR